MKIQVRSYDNLVEKDVFSFFECAILCVYHHPTKFKVTVRNYYWLVVPQIRFPNPV